MTKQSLFLAGLGAAALLLPTVGQATTITLTSPTDDARVYSGVPDTNYGSDANLLASLASVTGNVRQSFIKFDLNSLILAGVTAADITSLELRMWVYTSSGGTLNAYHSSDSWNEETITWNNRPSLSGEPLLGTSPALTPIPDYFFINLLAGGTSWLAADLADRYLSVALLLPPGTTVDTAYYICSKEANPAVCAGPALTVTYTPSTPSVPEPATLSLMGLGLAGLGIARRRKTH